MNSKNYNYKVHQLEVAPGIFSAIHNFSDGNKKNRIAVLLHGSVENGRIFFSLNGKGLAPFLAKNGYNVFVIDNRGRGKSKPKIKRNFKGGIFDYITKDLDKTFEYISNNDFSNQSWLMVCHSWAGVNLMSFYARNGYKYPIQKMVFFAVKRRVKLDSFAKFYYIYLMFNLIGTIVSELYKFLPAKKMGFGSDNETLQWHREIVKLIVNKKWLDKDGIDYIAALKKREQPKILNIVSGDDKYLGEKGDVFSFLEECNCSLEKVTTIHLTKENGYSKDYDHNNSLTAKNSEKEIFSKLLDWAR